MKKAIKRILLAALVVLAAYCFLTPMGALRLSVACTGYPVDAVTLTARIITDPADVGQTAFDTPDNVTLYKITSHVPYEWQTDGELENWAVTQHLIFYSANYHGWC